MHGYIQREIHTRLLADLSLFPAVALLGPRQAGKSTLAKETVRLSPESIYLDLESPSDLARMEEPELFLNRYGQHTIIIDEVQILPALFPVLRSIIDKNRHPGRFILLGSRLLVNKSAESLAGRISFLELTPFSVSECCKSATDIDTLLTLLNRGGFPESFLASDNSKSYRWRQEFIRSYVERDLPLLGLKAPVPLIKRLWQMIAHLQGQMLNSSKLAESLGISPGSIRSYLDFMEEAMLVRILPSWEGNLKKRLVKAPKIYIRDTGIANCQLQIADQDSLMGHPSWGAQWEALVVESCCSWFPDASASYYRTSNGSEVDLVLESADKRILIEAKASSNPSLSKGFWNAVADLSPDRCFVCAPVTSAYPIKNKVTVTDLLNLKAELQFLFS